MTNAQEQIKTKIVNAFLETFETLEVLFSRLNVNSDDEKVIRASIANDFLMETK